MSFMVCFVANKQLNGFFTSPATRVCNGNREGYLAVLVHRLGRKRGLAIFKRGVA